jgi:PPOX class probable F420-dependent enzyme
VAISDEKYVSFTTYRRDGTPVSSPVWIVPVDEHRVGFWTSSTSGKAKRLKNNPQVTLQPSNGRGRVRAGSEAIHATAALVSAGDDFDTVTRRVHAKYGLLTSITRLLAKVGAFVKRKPQPYGDRVVVVTLGPPDGGG